MVYFIKEKQIEDLPNEDWIDAEGYDGVYHVSNLGRVKSIGRWCDMGNGRERWIKERILSQQINIKHSSVRATLCQDGICKPYSVSRISFFSFNYNIKNLPEYFVVHKDNYWKNNRLGNLKIGTREEVGKLTFQHGKIDHLKKGNPILSKHNRDTALIINGEIVKKKCITCGETKDTEEFRRERNECNVCVWDARRKVLKTKKRRCAGLKTIDQITGEIKHYKNYNDPDLLKLISIATAMKHAKLNTVCKPYLKKQNFNPFKIEEIK